MHETVPAAAVVVVVLTLFEGHNQNRFNELSLFVELKGFS